MAAVTSFSIAALSPLGSGAIWRTIVNRAMLLNLYESITLPPKWVKVDLHIFHQNVGRLSLF